LAPAAGAQQLPPSRSPTRAYVPRSFSRAFSPYTCLSDLAPAFNKAYACTPPRSEEACSPCLYLSSSCLPLNHNCSLYRIRRSRSLLIPYAFCYHLRVCESTLKQFFNPTTHPPCRSANCSHSLSSSSPLGRAPAHLFVHVAPLATIF
jgi:hypothetical protein